MEILVIMLATFLAGVVQTVSGFGGSLVIMLFLPAVMPLMDAIMVNQTAMILLNISLIFTYRKSIRFRQVLLPAAVCLLFTTVFIDISLMVNVQTMKLLFGLFLIGISIYFWFFSQKVCCKASPAMACFCGALSGTTNALFGIGGPPIAVYYLAVSDSTDAYIGTTQFLFLITTLYTVLFRFSKGLVCEAFWKYALAGIAAILIGKLVGKKINDRISPEIMKRCVYVCLLLSGLMTVIQSLPSRP